MLDKVKVNASKGNPNVSSCEIAIMMLGSVIAKRTQFVELAGELDGTRRSLTRGEYLSAICS